MECYSWPHTLISATRDEHGELTKKLYRVQPENGMPHTHSVYYSNIICGNWRKTNLHIKKGLEIWCGPRHEILNYNTCDIPI